MVSSVDRAVTRSGTGLVLAVGLAPAAWFLHINLLPALVPLSCEIGADWPLHLATIVCLVPAAAGVFACHRIRRAADAAEGDAARRLTLWGSSGTIVGWLFLVLIVAEHVPVLVLSSCPP